MKRILIITLLYYIQINTAQAQSKDLTQLVSWMEGNYSNEEQHLKDTANYFNIKLNMTRIWNQRKDGYWLYVEQAVADYYDKPYRQRIYHVYEREPGIFVSEVYTLNDPLRFTHKPELCAKSLTADSLTQKIGCAVILKKINDKIYTGSTEAKKCASERQGAQYASAEVSISEFELKSWDRGYNANDEQVWGAEIAGYIFKKLK